MEWPRQVVPNHGSTRRLGPAVRPRKVLHEAGSLDIELDFTTVQRAAERVRTMLLDPRTRYDLARFEYCRAVRIAPTEIPHSHLNTLGRDETGLLTTYLHEQMHWY